MPTFAQLRERFPNASLGFLAANASDGLPPELAPSPPRPEKKPARGKTATPAKSKGNAHHDPAVLTAALERAQADYLASLAVVERHLCDGPLAKGQTEGGHPRKFLVRVTSFRVRLLDEDNLCEKYHVDLCRYAGLLRADDPGQARIVTTQEKVRTKAEERTEVVIEPMI
jgi:hypothetical protein